LPRTATKGMDAVKRADVVRAVEEEGFAVKG
jgi:hypothetical protein